MAQSKPELPYDSPSFRSSKFMLIVEILAVFALGMVVLLGCIGALGSGVFVSVIAIWCANLTMLTGIYWGLRSRGQGWRHFGLSHRILELKSIGIIVLQSIPVCIVSLLAFIVGAVVMANIVGMPEPADMSKYDYLRGNLGLTLVALVSVYFVSSFAEEVIYRGFLVTRLIELGGDQMLWRCVAIVFSSLVFGLVHSDWGVAGMVQASFMGVALGVSYLVVRRELWVTIFAHAYMDTLLILQMYMPTVDSGA